MGVCPHNEFESFSYFVLPVNQNGVINTLISQDPANPTHVAQLTIHANPGDIIRLRATIGWSGTVSRATVAFRIWRDAPITGTPIFEAVETGETGFDNETITDFSHDDTFFPEDRDYTYFLTAQVTPPPQESAAVLTGPITFTAVQIDHCSG